MFIPLPLLPVDVELVIVKTRAYRRIRARGRLLQPGTRVRCLFAAFLRHGKGLAQVMLQPDTSTYALCLAKRWKSCKFHLDGIRPSSHCSSHGVDADELSRSRLEHLIGGGNVEMQESRVREEGEEGTWGEVGDRLKKLIGPLPCLVGACMVSTRCLHLLHLQLQPQPAIFTLRSSLHPRASSSSSSSSRRCSTPHLLRRRSLAVCFSSRTSICYPSPLLFASLQICHCLTVHCLQRADQSVSLSPSLFRDSTMAR